jgi:2-haloacid dehalogenase
MTKDIKALFFDVFGTLADWRTGVARESERILGPLGRRLDWPAFADAWRGEYNSAWRCSARRPIRSAWPASV